MEMYSLYTKLYCTLLVRPKFLVNGTAVQLPLLYCVCK